MYWYVGGGCGGVIVGVQCVEVLLMGGSYCGGIQFGKFV